MSIYLNIAKLYLHIILYFNSTKLDLLHEPFSELLQNVPEILRKILKIVLKISIKFSQNIIRLLSKILAHPNSLKKEYFLMQTVAYSAHCARRSVHVCRSRWECVSTPNTHQPAPAFKYACLVKLLSVLSIRI